MFLIHQKGCCTFSYNSLRITLDSIYLLIVSPFRLFRLFLSSPGLPYSGYPCLLPDCLIPAIPASSRTALFRLSLPPPGLTLFHPFLLLALDIREHGKHRTDLLVFKLAPDKVVCAFLHLRREYKYADQVGNHH